jgi:hypothetical protein
VTLVTRFAPLLVALVAVAAVAACGAASRVPTSPAGSPDQRSLSQSHLLVAWKRIGDIALGETLKQVHSEYGAEGGYGYRLHGGTVDVEANQPPITRVNWIYFTTPYYKTRSGFGVGSSFPRRWRASFIWNGIVKDKPCNCWVKVGTGRRSLQPTFANFLKPWVVVDVKHGRVTSILLSSKYVD